MQLCHRETHHGTNGDAEYSGGLGTGTSQEFYSTSGAGHSSLCVLVTQAIQPQKEDSSSLRASPLLDILHLRETWLIPLSIIYFVLGAELRAGT